MYLQWAKNNNVSNDVFIDNEMMKKWNQWRGKRREEKYNQLMKIIDNERRKWISKKANLKKKSENMKYINEIVIRKGKWRRETMKKKEEKKSW